MRCRTFDSRRFCLSFVWFGTWFLWIESIPITQTQRTKHQTQKKQFPNPNILGFKKYIFIKIFLKPKNFWVKRLFASTTSKWNKLKNLINRWQSTFCNPIAHRLAFELNQLTPATKCSDDAESSPFDESTPKSLLPLRLSFLVTFGLCSLVSMFISSWCRSTSICRFFSSFSLRRPSLSSRRLSWNSWMARPCSTAYWAIASPFCTSYLLEMY